VAIGALGSALKTATAAPPALIHQSHLYERQGGRGVPMVMHRTPIERGRYWHTK
jgi:hypothetical protein